MVRLPKPGGDDGAWGSILNDFISVSHNSDGTLTSSAIAIAGGYSKPTQGIPASDLAQSVQTSLNRASTAVIENELVFNVKNYGAKGDGVTNDASAFQAAITACNVTGGGIVFIPPSSQVYIIGQPLLITIPIQILGCGWQSTILRLSPNVNDFMFKFAQAANQVIFGAIFRDFKMELGAPGQTAGGGIAAVSALHCVVDHIWFNAPRDYAIQFTQNAAGNGHHNKISRCLFDSNSTLSAGQGIALSFSGADECFITDNDFENMGGTAGCAVMDFNGSNHYIGNVFVNCFGGIWQRNTQRGVIVGNIFDTIGGDSCIKLGGGTGSMSITSNSFFNIGDGPNPNNTFCIFFTWAQGMSAITGNTFEISSTGNTAGAVGFNPGQTVSGVTISGNAVRLLGSPRQGVISGSTQLTKGCIITSNAGYNPLGVLTALTILASGSSYTNTFATDCIVYVTAHNPGTTTMTLDGTTIATITNGSTTNVHVPIGSVVTLSYDVVPTWTWYGL